MVAHAQVFQLQLVTAINGHFFHGINAIAPGAVVMQRTFQVVVTDKVGQFVFYGLFNKYIILTQFGFTADNVDQLIKATGPLELGKLADVIVLDRNVMAVPVDQIADTKVIETVVGGQVVYSAENAVKATAPIASSAVAAGTRERSQSQRSTDGTQRRAADRAEEAIVCTHGKTKISPGHSRSGLFYFPNRCPKFISQLA